MKQYKYTISIYDNDNTGYKFTVIATDTEEAIGKARQEYFNLFEDPIGYNLLEVETREQLESLSFDYEYEVRVEFADGSSVKYEVESDSSNGAILTAIDFATDDYESKEISCVEVLSQRQL